MATTRQQYKEYCLRALGAPVLEINVEDDQLEDRIDEALEYWRLYHYDGIEKVYMKHQIKASILNLVETNADQFEIGSTVVGQTSGAKTKITGQTDRLSAGHELFCVHTEGSFVAGETIVEQGRLTSATLQSTPIVLGEMDLKYIETPDWVYGVTRMLPFAGTQTSKSMFDIQYQLRLNDLYDLTSTSIIYYKMVMSHLSLLDLELNGKPMFRFNRLQNRLYPDISWGTDVLAGDYVVLECYRGLDPSQFGKVWSEPWLKHYGIALFKRQWGVNLKKFGGLQLPGGVTLDGQSMYAEAIQEMKDLEDELMTKSAPLEWFMG